jgi:hypothetical protein
MRPWQAQGEPWENPQDRRKNCENYSENEKKCHSLGLPYPSFRSGYPHTTRLNN